MIRHENFSILFKEKYFRTSLKFNIGLRQKEIISMQNNFNGLQKNSPNVGAKMSGSICDGQYVVICTACAILLSSFDLVRK